MKHGRVALEIVFRLSEMHEDVRLLVGRDSYFHKPRDALVSNFADRTRTVMSHMMNLLVGSGAGLRNDLLWITC